MKLYGETMLIGVDLITLTPQKPSTLTRDEWRENYGGLWPNYINELEHPSLGMYAIHPTHDDISIGFGVRVEYFLANFSHLSYDRFKVKVAQSIRSVLHVAILPDDIKYHHVQFLLDVEVEE